MATQTKTKQNDAMTIDVHELTIMCDNRNPSVFLINAWIDFE
jgi:hypothetical protein